MVTVEKPTAKDLTRINDILSFWTNEKEASKYIERVRNEISGETEFNLHFWVAKVDALSVGIVGLCDPLPKILPFAKTEKPGELKVLYLDEKERGRGTGKILLRFIEEEALNEGYQEILVRSAARYKDTAYAFYEKMGYQKVGIVESSEDPQPMQVFAKTLPFKESK